MDPNRNERPQKNYTWVFVAIIFAILFLPGFAVSGMFYVFIPLILMAVFVFVVVSKVRRNVQEPGKNPQPDGRGAGPQAQPDKWQQARAAQNPQRPPARGTKQPPAPTARPAPGKYRTSPLNAAQLGGRDPWDMPRERDPWE